LGPLGVRDCSDDHCQLGGWWLIPDRDWSAPLRASTSHAEARNLCMNPVAFYFLSLTTSVWNEAGSPGIAGVPMNSGSKKFVLMA
jgi:hypothetical protein